MNAVPGYYPTIIQEARYGGAYARGSWVLTAGTHYPEADTDAWAGDSPCQDFWNEVGPASITSDGIGSAGIVEGDKTGNSIIVVSGTDLEAMVDEAQRLSQDNREVPS